MKKIFTLSVEADDNEFRDAENEFLDRVKALEFKFALSDLDQWLRNFIKYDNSLSESVIGIYQSVRSELHRILLERNIEI